MKRRFKFLTIALAVAGVLALIIGGVALAAGPNKTNTQGGANPGWGCPYGQGNIITLTSDLTGLTTQEITTQLQQDKSLVEIAATKGVTEAKLVEALLTPTKQFIQQRVDSGFWTKEQADAHLKWMEQHLTQVVNNKGFVNGNPGVNGGCGGGVGPGMMGGWGNSGTGSSFGRGMMGGGMMGGWGSSGTGNGFGRGMMGGWGRSY